MILIYVLEIHEAFAGQVLANIEALESDDFAKENFGRDKAVGKVNFDNMDEMKEYLNKIKDELQNKKAKDSL